MGHEDKPIFVLAAAFRAFEILARPMDIPKVPPDQGLGGASISAQGALEFIRVKLSVTVINTPFFIWNNQNGTILFIFCGTA